MSIYLCGITSSEYENIKELTDPIWEVVDGLIFCVDDGAAKDGTLDLLEERKKSGEILYREWNNWHDAQMNVWLSSKKLKNGDWCIFRDSMERFNPEWAAQLPQLLDSMTIQKVNTIYNYGKIFAFKYNDNLYFNGSPHFGLSGSRPVAIDFAHYFSEDDHEHTWRLRDGEAGGRPKDNKIDHEAKYLWVYGRSNHLQLGVDLGDENAVAFMNRAENIRLISRQEAAYQHITLETVEGLKEYIYFLLNDDEDRLKTFIDSARVWKNFYRYHILGHDFDEIEASENDWSYELEPLGQYDR